MDFLVELRDLGALKQEHFVLLSLNGSNRLISRHVVFIGTVNSVVAHPREVYAHALDDRASRIVVAHNHPSGDPEPSGADVATTQSLVAAGIIMGIHLSDHLIITADGHFSFREKGML